MALENYFFHYIRKYNRSYPYFNFLHENNFKKIITSKIDKLIKIGDDIDTKYKKKKYIFSFDDGLKDHLFASNILKKKNILGIFFINTVPIIEKKILNVHKLHLIFGRFKSEEIIKELYSIESINLENIKIPSYKRYQLENSLDKDHINKLKLKVFLNQNKNFFLINKLFNFFFSKLTQKKILEKFYLSRDDIIDIDRKGMIIGGHSHSHKILSSLSFKDQNKEIKKNINYLSKILKKKIDFFASPWGDKKSYNTNTIKILKKNVKYHFTTLQNKVLENNYEIPRINCNKLKYGKIFNYKKNDK